MRFPPLSTWKIITVTHVVNNHGELLSPKDRVGLDPFQMAVHGLNNGGDQPITVWIDANRPSTSWDILRRHPWNYEMELLPPQEFDS